MALPPPTQATHRILIVGGLAIGLADLVFATTFWWTRNVPPVRILQSIAAGLLGGDSYAGGAATAVLGALLHFLIAIAFVVACHLLLRRWPRLARHPVRHGFVYGLLLYLAMNFVVLPLSAAGMPDVTDLPWVAPSVVVHLAIGIACFAVVERASASGARRGAATAASGRRREP